MSLYGVFVRVLSLKIIHFVKKITFRINFPLTFRNSEREFSAVNIHFNHL